MKIRIDPNDVLFSKIIRLTAKGKCQRCLKPTEFNRLQTAHFHGRANRKVRWDERNACGLCYGCHAYLDSRAMEKVEFFKKRLGEAEFEKLNHRANWRDLRKIDKKLVEIILKARLKDLC